MDNRSFDAYKKSVMTHGHHSCQKAYSMAMDTICAYPPSQHEFPHWKYVLRCCDNFPRIDITIQESDKHHSNKCIMIHSHVYHLTSWCSVLGIFPLSEKEICSLCLCDTDSMPPVKLYTRKYLVMIETSISDLHRSFYIPEIQKLEFHPKHVWIIATHHCGNTHREAFKHRRELQYMLWNCDYYDRVVASWAL